MQFLKKDSRLLSLLPRLTKTQAANQKSRELMDWDGNIWLL